MLPVDIVLTVAHMRLEGARSAVRAVMEDGTFRSHCWPGVNAMQVTSRCCVMWPLFSDVGPPCTHCLAFCWVCVADPALSASLRGLSVISVSWTIEVAR